MRADRLDPGTLKITTGSLHASEPLMELGAELLHYAEFRSKRRVLVGLCGKGSIGISAKT
jgi:hypothetical protein